MPGIHCSLRDHHICCFFFSDTAPTEIYPSFPTRRSSDLKGGRQDRVLTTDLILPAHSGKLPISSFCVEQGRWTRRGNEPAEQFGTSDKVVAFKQLKIA